MTRAGKRGKKGHLRHADNRSFCGLTLSGVTFSDETIEPGVCKRCSAAVLKAHGADHHHTQFKGGCWYLVVPAARSLFFVTGSGVATYSTACGIDGCNRMVTQTVIHNSVTATTTTTTVTSWGWAA